MRKGPRCSVADPGCYGRTGLRCFRCGRPACGACALDRVIYQRYGRQRLCHDCALGDGHFDLVIRHLVKLAPRDRPSQTSLMLRAANPPPPSRTLQHAARWWPPMPTRSPPPDPFGDPVDPPHISERGKLEQQQQRRPHGKRRS